jgi:hypothetical protein
MLEGFSSWTKGCDSQGFSDPHALVVHELVLDFSACDGVAKLQQESLP